MNERRAFALLSLLAALLLGACSKDPGTPPLEGARVGGPFTLVNQDGREVTERDFGGQYRLVYFGYSYCPDVCPVDLQVIGQGLRQFEKEAPDRAERVTPIFITTDPERDTPAVLKEYVGNFHPRLVGLTGTPQQIADVAKSHGIFYARQGEEGVKDYLVDHSRLAMLFGPEGKPIAIVPHDEGAGAIAAELDKWVT